MFILFVRTNHHNAILRHNFKLIYFHNDRSEGPYPCLCLYVFNVHHIQGITVITIFETTTINERTLEILSPSNFSQTQH